MFSIHTTPERLKNTTILGHFGFHGKRMIIVTASSLKSSVFSNSSGLKKVFEDLCFRDRISVDGSKIAAFAN